MEVKEWVLPNRIYFNKWVYQQFHPSKYTSKEKGAFDADPSQRLVRDFLQYDSPYRGLLVYHGLGTGKTCTSILSTESFIQHKSKIVVMTPASLENNYRKELKKCSQTGGLLRKKWTKVQLQFPKDQTVYDSLKKMFGFTKSFIDKHQQTLWLPYLPKELPKERIISEPTSIRSMSVEDKAKVEDIYEYIIDQRYLFLHYNGLTNKKLDELEKKNEFNKDIFDDTIVVIDEVHTFISRVVNGGKIARRIYNMLISKPNLKLILLSGTPVINQPFELCFTLNLLRGSMKEYTVSMLKDEEMPSLEVIKEALDKEKVLPFIDEIRIDQGNQQIKFTLMPSGFIHKEKDSVEIIKSPKIYDTDEWMDKMIRKLKKHIKVNARVKKEEHTSLPDRREDFTDFFFDRTDPENPTIKQENYNLFMKRITGIVSYFKISDATAFPEKLPMIYQSVPMSPTQFTYYVEVRNTEIKKDELQKKKAARRQGEVDIFKTNSSYRAFSRMACNYVFPEKIKRPFPSEIHAKFLKRELDIQEEEEGIESKEKLPTGDVMKEYEKELSQALQALEDNGDKNKTDMIINLFNADMRFLPSTIQKQLQDAKQTENLRGKLASLLMITQSGAEGLNLRNVRNVYILEPFWNQVRIDQVIGRAIRKGSHLELPEDERNVQVTMFLASFTKTQAKANKTIQFKDNALTTDENIRDLALKKDKIIQQFLQLVKANAVDCVFNANKNQPRMDGYTCFAYPINANPSHYNYLPSIQEDKKTSAFGIRERDKKLKGSVVMKGNIKYVKLPNDDTLYDYQAYKDAGVLISSIN